MTQSLEGLYRQLETATPIHDYFLVLNKETPTLEKKGNSCLVTLYKKTLGTSYVIEDACKKTLDLLIKEKEHLYDGIEAIKLCKICLTIQKIISHVIEKRLPNRSSHLQQIHNQLNPLELYFITHAATKEGTSPFLCACAHGMFLQAISLIDKTTDLKKASKYYPDLLVTAYQENKIELCLELIRLGANPQKAFKTNSSLCINSLLATAITKRDTRTSIQLINSGSDLNDSINEQEERVLHLACREGLQEVVRILCVKGANCNLQDIRGNTALHTACAALHIDIALFLANRADVSITCHKGLSAFSLPSLCTAENQQARITSFYTTLFKDIPFARDKIPSTNFTSFITTCHSKPQDLIKDSIKASPFEIPLLLQSRLLAKGLTTQFSLKEFTTSFEKLRQKFPHTTLDVIEFSHLSLQLDHLTYKLPELRITPPEKPINLRELLDLFGKITLIRRNSPYFLDPYSLKSEIKNRSYSELEALVSEVIDRVEKRIEFMGTPRKGSIAIDKFYDIIENSLKSIIAFFHQAPDTNATAHLLVSFFF